MAKGKQQKKKRMKKYKGKYVTANRLDMSKGGRVSLQEGGNPPKYGDTRVKNGVKEQFSPVGWNPTCLLYTSPSPRDVEESRMPSSA